MTNHLRMGVDSTREQGRLMRSKFGGALCLASIKHQPFTNIQCVSKVPPEQWSKLELAMYRECVGNAGMNSKLMTSVVDWLE